MLEDGSRHVHLPFSIPLHEQVVDELIVRSPLAPVVFMCIVEHMLDVSRQAVLVLEEQRADMLLLPPALFAKLLDFVTRR